MKTQDLNRVMAIQEQCYQRIAPESLESITAKLSMAPESCLVAVFEGRVVGYLLSFPWNSLQPPELDSQSANLPTVLDTFYIHDLAVSKSARTLGVGSRLVEEGLKMAIAEGFHCSHLIAVQNSEAFWERQGFERIESVLPETMARLRSYSSECVYMKKAL